MLATANLLAGRISPCIGQNAQVEYTREWINNGSNHGSDSKKQRLEYSINVAKNNPTLTNQEFKAVSDHITEMGAEIGKQVEQKKSVVGRLPTNLPRPANHLVLAKNSTFTKKLSAIQNKFKEKLKKL